LTADSDAVRGRAAVRLTAALAGRCAAATAAKVRAPALRARHRAAPSRPVAKSEDADLADRADALGAAVRELVAGRPTDGRTLSVPARPTRSTRAKRGQ